MSEYEIATLSYMWWQNAIAIGGFLLTIISIGAVYLDYRHRKNKEAADKAIDMAKYFMDEILMGLAIIGKEFTAKGIDKILRKHKFFKYEDFDKNELDTLFTEKEIKELSKKIGDIKVDLPVELGKTVNVNIGSFCAIILNKLEYMCMYLSSRVADDSYIYNSLHQVFLNSVQLLYFNIANLNVDEKDKYYRNIIDVYNNWKNKYLKEQNKEEKCNEKIKQHERKLKKKISKSKKIN